MIPAIRNLANAAEFYIPTPMVDALHERLTQWTWCGLTGGAVYGDSRSGKSKAIQALSNTIVSRSGQPIPVFRVSYGDRDVPNIKTVFVKIAHSLDITIKRTSYSDTLVEDISNCLAEAALMNAERQVVLITDEAQLLSIRQLSAFAEIFNQLFEMKINGVFVFVANKDQFGPLAKQLLEEQNAYLLNRFFSNLYEFNGITNSEELKKCLSEYDQYLVTEQPAVTATEYFCPALYAQGWRLAELASKYWYYYCSRYQKIVQRDSWQMATFIRATNLLLMDYLPSCTDRKDQVLLEACIIKSLEAALIPPTLVRIAS